MTTPNLERLPPKKPDPRRRISLRCIVPVLYVVAAFVTGCMIGNAFFKKEYLNVFYYGAGLVALFAFASPKGVANIENWLLNAAFEPDVDFLHWHPKPPDGVVHDTSSLDFQNALNTRVEEIAERRGGWLHNESNLELAKAQLSGISTDEAREIEKSIRAMIEHENTLMNNRIQWFLTITGFLITAIFLSSRIAENSIFITLMALVGMAISLSFWLSLSTGRKAVGRLLALWNAYRVRAVPSFNETGVIGSRLIGGWNYLAPWWALPPILLIFWLAVMVNSCFAPEALMAPTPGTYVFLDKQKLEGIGIDSLKCSTSAFRFDTKSGKIECIKY
jgi:hypothetical protein